MPFDQTAVQDFIRPDVLAARKEIINALPPGSLFRLEPCDDGLFKFCTHQHGGITISTPKTIGDILSQIQGGSQTGINT